MYLDATERLVQILDESEYEHELFQLLAKREDIISQINTIDASAGMIVKNEAIEVLLLRIRKEEQQLLERMAGLKQEAARHLHSLKQAKEVKNLYYNESETSDGVFYDKKR